ncbi:hypothetical protein FRB95_002177 [Tulasnella sp. JGI-2019a]|nr:hypothetical protein FRB95_002177 [Tulasnella sp. JGI-2019a]
MDPRLSPPISRNLSSTTVSQLGERAPLLAGDEEQGAHYIHEATGTSHPAKAPKEDKEITNKDIFWTRLRYYVPSVVWIPQYSFDAFWGDAAAGITVASILIPQSMSYATSVAQLDATTGLFAAALPGFIYALLGSSRHLNVGPEASLSLLVGECVTRIRRGDPHEDTPPNAGIIASTIITFQVGLISFLLGLFRLGFIDVVLSRALQRGFITGVGFVIMIGQLIPLLGLSKFASEVNPETTLDKIVFLVENTWTNAHPLTAAISLGAVLFIFTSRAIKLRARSRFPAIFYVPEIFLLIVLTTVLSQVFRWDQDGVSVLGRVSIHHDGAFIKFPISKHTLTYLTDTTSTAIVIAVAGFIESVVAAKQNAQRFNYTISPNRESVALGLGNLASSFLPGTIPAYGAVTRSKLNGDCGGTTQMASIITSSLVLLAIFFLLPALYFLPSCVLAAVILIVVYGLISEAPHDIAYYWRMRAYEDFTLMSLTFLSTVLWSVEVGIVVSVTLSLLLVVRNSSKTSMKILGRIPGTNKWMAIDEEPEAREDTPGVLIIRIKESLDFANAAQMRERLGRLELYGSGSVHPGEAARRERAEILVFHMADVEKMDASATLLFAEMILMYRQQNVDIHFAHLRAKLLPQFHLAGCDIPEDQLHGSVAEAIRAIETE